MTTPANKTFRATPSTLVIERPNGEEKWIGSELFWEPEADPPIIVTNRALGEDRWFPCDSLEEVAPEMWKGTLWTEGPLDGPTITIRPTSEDDAVSAVSMAGFPSIPMPLPVIAAYHASDGVFAVPEIYAMSEDDGFVATMMLSSDAGLFVRYSGAWHAITDEDVVDGLTVNDVEDTALIMFDQFDRAGQLVHVSAMPLVDGGTTVKQAPDPEAAPESAVTASLTRDVPVFASAGDLSGAVAAAQADPDLRWWVERRAKALGLEPDFPWA